MDGTTPSETLPRYPRRPSLDDASTTRPRGPPQAPDASAGLEPDTCRICRGEATPKEPLFYPCKCSGSIKYVHQDCLMEWLSHSQKKHCELCKTPFRFTKLYSSSMPRKLPTLVFLSHLVKYFVRNMLLWLRVMLVFSVWMVVLPILTRWEWSFFFWISEEGLAAPPTTVAATSAATVAATAQSEAHVQAALGMLRTHNESSALDDLAYADMDDGSSSSLLSGLFRALLDVAGAPDMGSLLATGNGTENSAFYASTSPPSLLGEVGFLRDLTRYRTLNRFIIYTLEGQFITFLVVICFILIILVRDYVVQQQPEINMRAAFAAADAGGVNLGAGGDPGVPGVPPGDLPPGDAGAGHGHHDHDHDHHDHHDHHHHHHHHHGHGHGHPHGHFRDWDHESDDSEWETDSNATPPPDNDFVFNFDHDPDPPVPDTDESAVELPTAHDTTSPTQASSPTLQDAMWSAVRDEAGKSSAQDTSAQSASPTAASASAVDEPGLPPAVANLARFPLSNESGATVQEYMQIYRRGGGDPARILQIAREENLEEHMKYWLGLMEIVMEKRQDRASNASSSSNALAADAAVDAAANVQTANPQPSVQDMAQRMAEEVASRSSKGKERADEPVASGEENGSARPSTGLSEFEYGLRPRANTDGPSSPARINPLANNNWSFLPGEGVQPDASAPTSAADIQENPFSMFSSPRAKPRDPPGGDANDTGMADVYEEAAGDSMSQTDMVPPTDAGMDTPAGAAPNLAALRGGLNPNEANRDGDAAPQQPPPQQQQQQPAVAGSLLDGVANFMWRDLDNIDPADLPPIPEDQDDDHGQLFNENEDPENLDEDEREAFEEAAAAAAAANLEAEAIEDAEDLEGVMELLGMRGPIVGLFQNVIFCGILVTVSLLVGVFLPYNIGRLSIWVIANPMRPVMVLFSLSELLQDAAAVVLGGCAYATVYVLHAAALFLQMTVGWTVPAIGYLASSLTTTWDLCATAAMRVYESIDIAPPYHSGEIRNFSAISHEALISLKGHVGTAAVAAGQAAAAVVTGDVLSWTAGALGLARSTGVASWALLKTLPALLSNPGAWVITLDTLEPVQINPAFAYWDSGDRCLAILLGYASMCLVAGLYLHRGMPFSSGPTGQDWEASLIDGLSQASGVLKVILIIGIEMLVFPLYCGLLLDVALLPLFEDTTLKSRLYFSVNYPLTSIFVHWFVGTGYMFHFALFVSMCRKIMRKGVLYFIRDPDDPEFHPVRDVLERNVTTQLRKILFSAFVYGGLVTICLGGVVWGLAYAGPGVLPIHYSSNEPVLEFPIDLLFYNFLMPLAIRFFKPSDGLHAMYTWWFRKSARMLRITWFLFGERKVDEEGVLALPPNSPYHRFPWFTKRLLTYDEAVNEVVPSLLQPARFEGFHAEGGRTFMLPGTVKMCTVRKRGLVASGQLVPDGSFVRAPASDQVKIPKGRKVFLDLADPAASVDGTYELGSLRGVGTAAAAADPPLDEVYRSAQYELVYIPPHFRLRIFFFIAFIWIFAAVTGVSFTIVPLLFGRRLFRMLLPADVRTNDIYAFSIGIYVLGSAAYLAFHLRTVAELVQSGAHRAAAAVSRSALSAVLTAARVAMRAAKLAYAYFFLVVVFPLLATALVELYVLIPLHTYMDAPVSFVAPSSGSGADISRHTVRIIQSWTLGLLYLKVAARTVTSWYPETRLASAIRAVLRRGHLDPDAQLLTRAFVVPGLVLAAVALGLPLVLADAAVGMWLQSAAAAAATDVAGAAPPSPADIRVVYRLSFPFVALIALLGWSVWGMVGVFGTWKMRIRDEAYLVGERLHNFGVTNSAPSAATRRALRAGAAPVRG